MKDVKRLILLALVLAFLAGLGAGTWIGDLRAAPAEPSTPSVDLRVQEYAEHYGLNKSEQRRFRDVILRYDAERMRILTELDTARWQRLERLREDSRTDLRAILKEREEDKNGTGGSGNGG